VTYFEELASAYGSNDYYGILDYYANDAFREIWRASVKGGQRVRDLLRWNSGDLGHEVERVFLGEVGAINLVRWEDGGGLSTVSATMVDGLIAAETVYDHAGWMEVGLRAASEVIANYEKLYEAYAEAWPDGEATGLDLSQTVNTVDVSGPAVFLGPASFMEDPGRAVALYNVTDTEACTYQVAVLLQVAGGSVVEDTVYQEANSISRCLSGPPSSGWWTGLELPLPRDQLLTGTIETNGGQEVEIHNGSLLLDEFLISSFDLFGESGLAEPRFDSVTFEPTRKCVDRSGRLLQDKDSRDLFLCLYETDLCPGDSQCAEPTLTVHSSVLHEFAHAWILDHVDEATQVLLLEATGREVWSDDDVPWAERGVEYAAEVITWGVMGVDAPMVRISSPTCEELAASFQLLTDTEPQGGECELG